MKEINDNWIEYATSLIQLKNIKKKKLVEENKGKIEKSTSASESRWWWWRVQHPWAKEDGTRRLADGARRRRQRVPAGATAEACRGKKPVHLRRDRRRGRCASSPNFRRSMPSGGGRGRQKKKTKITTTKTKTKKKDSKKARTKAWATTSWLLSFHHRTEPNRTEPNQNKVTNPLTS